MAFSTLNSPTSLSGTDTVEIEGTARWARVVAIIALVFLGLTLAFGIVFSRMIGSLLTLQAMMTGQALPIDPSTIGNLYMVITVIIVVIYFFPTFFLLQYAHRTLRALRNGFAPADFTEGLRAHRSFYTYMGILLMVFGALYLLSTAALVFAYIAMPALPPGLDGGTPM